MDDRVAPRIKLCGITSLADARLAVEAGAWAIGCIMWTGSPRACDPAEAARIAAELRRRVEVVGVFVNAPLAEVTGMVDGLGLTMVQLHGDEGPAYCGEVARRTGAKVMKAAAVRLGADIQALEAFHTDLHLLDAHRPGMRGGTGETFDWELVRTRRSSIPLVLSGGLTADNVGAAIAAVHPYAVDAASGTEASPGVKDPEKLHAFVSAVRDSAVEVAS
ncbi:MAG: phosphoribosylanthranilate isomerase [Solirubrobacteraceae bacterium]|jgi:phosphoribosylanthranilate isomerase|nr:phosphoribosylanthranilate isomerase [Solirubrobacteraceae bacterium]MEA2395648.1 phosphoribosylanthranilate isomerase [Solirubrobacteraceae bacterium]